MLAVVEIGDALLGNESLKPSPGNDGITTWKGWSAPASSGSVKGVTNLPNDKLVKGKGGIKSKGTAFA